MTSLRVQQGREFLFPFFARAEGGELARAAELKQASASLVGHVVPKRNIYRLLDRHGWRKLVPRPLHPQAKAQFKKPLRRTFKRQ